MSGFETHDFYEILSIHLYFGNSGQKQGTLIFSGKKQISLCPILECYIAIY